MELLLVIGGCWLVFWVLRQAFGTKSVEPDGPTDRTRPPRNEGASRSTSQQPPPTKDIYRPKAGNTAGSKIVFETPKSGSSGPLPTQEALDGLHDAFTGAPLKLTLGLHQCINCKVYYHTASFDVLRQENSSRCVACGGASIVALSVAEARTSRGRDYTPEVITLDNFRSCFDRVVTFEGRVHDIRVSRRGSDFAVMFENRTWTRGLKLVFFRGAVRTVGGPDFIQALNGKNIRVRGLLVNDERYGPQIIVSERGMILSVSR